VLSSDPVDTVSLANGTYVYETCTPARSQLGIRDYGRVAMVLCPSDRELRVRARAATFRFKLERSIVNDGEGR
jgi:formylmethanofuran dehydrogenase subunit E